MEETGIPKGNNWDSGLSETLFFHGKGFHGKDFQRLGENGISVFAKP